MELKKLLVVTWVTVWACLWGAGRGDASYRDQVAPQVTHDSGDASYMDQVAPQASHGQYLSPLSDRDRARILRYRWPDKIIPLAFSHFYAEKYKSLVYQAMDLFNDLTCVRVINATNMETYHIRVMFSDDCGAVQGYFGPKDGFQEVHLGAGCFVALGYPVHELMHAMGFRHQHVRFDRDDNILVLRENIFANDYKDNFAINKRKGDYLWTMGLPYDFNSVMQYPEDAFGYDRAHLPTMKPKVPFNGWLGQVEGPSRSDIAMINRYYECWDHYLGDDILDAVPYEEFHTVLTGTYKGKVDEPKPFSNNFKNWLLKMKSLENR
ncbi:low choriolytic enzyme [Procambarus clarkii]|uniref:low choriolytic enzyme n=1 Tax=Procambarus clarkii TaxID=6728 RepID=UPI003743E5E9